MDPLVSYARYDQTMIFYRLIEHGYSSIHVYFELFDVHYVFVNLFVTSRNGVGVGVTLSYCNCKFFGCFIPVYKNIGLGDIFNSDFINLIERKMKKTSRKFFTKI